MSELRTIYAHELNKLEVGTKLVCVASFDPEFYLVGEVYEICIVSSSQVAYIEDEYTKSGHWEQVRDRKYHEWDLAVLADWSWGCRFEILLEG